jgi:hypothetical protein
MFLIFPIEPPFIHPSKNIDSGGDKKRASEASFPQNSH